MKSTILSLFVLATATATMHDSVMSLGEFRDACMKELNIDASSMPARQMGQGPPQGPPPEPDQKIKCLMACVMEKAQILVNGALQTDKIDLPPGATGVSFDSCKSVTASEKCENAWKIEQCIRQLLPKPPQ